MCGSKAKTEINTDQVYVNRVEREAKQSFCSKGNRVDLFFFFSCQVLLLPLTNQSIRKMYYCSYTGVIEQAWIWVWSMGCWVRKVICAYHQPTRSFLYLRTLTRAGTWYSKWNFLWATGAPEVAINASLLREQYSTHLIPRFKGLVYIPS